MNYNSNNDKKKNSTIRLLVINIFVIIMVVTFTIIGVFAYKEAYATNTDDVIGSVMAQGYLKGENIGPVLDYLKDGVSSVIKVTNETNESITTETVLNNVTRLDEQLKSVSFKYALLTSTDQNFEHCSSITDATYSDCDVVASGDFTGADTTDGLSLAAGIEVPANSTLYYKLIIYIDGTIENNHNLMGKNLNGTWQVNNTTVYTISLDDKCTTEGNPGTTLVYESYGNKFYHDSNGNKMTTTKYPITIPTCKGYSFNGYYDSVTGGNIRLNSNGYLASELSPTSVNDNNQTWHGRWTPSIYTITLDSRDADTHGTGEIYEKYANGYYLNSNGSNKMTSSNNPITKPTKTNYSFNGYYTEYTPLGESCRGTQYIDGNGKITSNASNTNFYDNGSLYACFNSSIYTITLDSSDANSHGTTEIYEKYEDGIYKDSGYEQLMTTSSNNISIPVREYTITLNHNYEGSTDGSVNVSYPFLGYYTESGNNGTQLINNTGYITNDFTNTYFNAAGTLYAHWGSGTSDTVTAPTRDGYTFDGWYTETNGGTKVLNANGSFTGTAVEGYTSTNAWVVTENKTLYAHWNLNAPAIPTITPSSIGKIYGASSTMLTCTTTTTYPSGIDIYYEFGWSLTNRTNSTITWLGNASTSPNINISATNHFGQRYFHCRVYASDGTNNSGTYPSMIQRGASMILSNAKITFDANGGNLSGTSPLYTRTGATGLYTGLTNSTSATAPIATRAGYIFDGWYTSASGGSKVLNSDGSFTGEAVSGYTDTNKWVVTENKILYAHWNYTINYYQGNLDGSNPTLLGTSTCIAGESVNLRTYNDLQGVFPYSSSDTTNPKNWKFAGWSTSETGTNRNYTDGSEITCSGNINLFAVGKHDLQFCSGNPVSCATAVQYWNPYSTNKAYRTTVTVPTPNSINNTWNFHGYKVGSNVAGSSVNFNSNTVGTSVNPAINNKGIYRAIYKRTLTVSYNANGGSGTTNNTTLLQYYNSGKDNSTNQLSSNEITLSGNSFTKVGYGFGKWAEGSADGTQYSEGSSYTGIGTTIDDTTITKTMYAVWVPGIYTIILNNNGANTAGTPEIYEKFNSGYYLNNIATRVMSSTSNNITIPSMNDYTFKGYYTEYTPLDEDCHGTKYIDSNGYITSSANNQNFSNNGTLYACFQKIKYNATIYYNSTTGIKSTTVSCNANNGSCNAYLPDAVINSTKEYSNFIGLSNQLNTMNVLSNSDDRITLTSNGGVYYSVYKTNIIEYLYGQSGAYNRTIYKNSYFTSTTSINTVLSETTDGTSTTVIMNSGAGNSSCIGWSTSNDTNVSYTTINLLISSNASEVYRVYQMKANFTKDYGIKAIDASYKTCLMSYNGDNCNVISPEITPKPGYSSTGWFSGTSTIPVAQSQGVINLSTNNSTYTAKSSINSYNLSFDLNYFDQNMEQWDLFYSEQFIVQNLSNGMNQVTSNGYNGKWEQIYYPIEVNSGSTYTISFDYDIPNNYNTISNYTGVGYQVLRNVPLNSHNPDYLITQKYLPTNKTTSTQNTSITFTAQVTGLYYFVFNFGMAADGETTTINLGNFRITVDNIPDRTVYYNSSIGSLSTPVRDGYTFNGWYTERINGDVVDSSTTMPYENTTYYAHWTYSTTFDNNFLNGDFAINSSSVDNYANFTTADIAAKSHLNITHGVSGGYAPGAKGGNVLFIRLNNTGNTGRGVFYTYSNFYGHTSGLTPGNTYTWSAYVRSNRIGTMTIGQEQGGLKTIDLNYSWQKVSYTFVANSSSSKAIVFYFNGVWNNNDYLYIHSVEISEGDGSSDKTVMNKNYGEALGTLPTPSRLGYTFAGWYTKPNSGTQISSSTTVPFRKHTYYAMWEANTYTITYNLNGGSGVPSTQTFVYNRADKIYSTIPTRSGYRFTGYKDPNNVIRQPGETVPWTYGNFTLTAQWEAVDGIYDYRCQNNNTDDYFITTCTSTMCNYSMKNYSNSGGGTIVRNNLIGASTCVNTDYNRYMCSGSDKYYITKCSSLRCAYTSINDVSTSGNILLDSLSNTGCNLVTYTPTTTKGNNTYRYPLTTVAGGSYYNLPFNQRIGGLYGGITVYRTGNTYGNSGVEIFVPFTAVSSIDGFYDSSYAYSSGTLTRTNYNGMDGFLAWGFNSYFNN